MRTVIKIGTNVIFDQAGNLDEKRVKNMAQNIARLYHEGNEIILVSSGAVAAGRFAAPGLSKDTHRKVLAAIGQPRLMEAYTKAFQDCSLNVGQCLISRDDLMNRESFNNLINIFDGFFSSGVVPIINENDALAPRNVYNDALAAMLGIAVQAEHVVFLTNQPGLMTGDPNQDKDVKLIPVVSRVDKEIERLCSKGTSVAGSGGMISKVKSAEQAVLAGITVHIADGRVTDIITKIFQGESVGTRFIACAEKVTSEQKRWLMVAKGYGQIVVDAGAATALKNGKSLLLPGVVAVKGSFEEGSVVEVSSNGKILAYGKINFSEKELKKLLAQRKKTDVKVKEIIHCNYMVVLK